MACRAHCGLVSCCRGRGVMVSRVSYRKRRPSGRRHISSRQCVQYRWPSGALPSVPPRHSGARRRLGAAAPGVRRSVLCRVDRKPWRRSPHQAPRYAGCKTDPAQDCPATRCPRLRRASHNRSCRLCSVVKPQARAAHRQSGSRADSRARNTPSAHCFRRAAGIARVTAVEGDFPMACCARSI